MSDTSETTLSNSTILADYKAKTPGSAALAEEARQLLPSGIAHDARHLDPYALYCERGEGPFKWDVDGNRYIDYYGGHGALLLGHSRPEVLAAAEQALSEGTQYGANHPREVTWAKTVCRMVPSAERVRFTSSGTEATLMALRLSRAFTGRSKIIRFKSMFHGWHDHMAGGVSDHFDGTPTTGVLAGIAGGVVLLPPGDAEALRSCLASDPDIAAIIIEPTGASFGQVPVTPDFLAVLREETARHGVVLIFDEVVTGFRVSPGGAQGAFGITPDLTTLAKIVAGGLPGGAVCGRRDIMDGLDFAATAAAKREKIGHPGTFNANPVSAASGIAALEIIESTDACERANAAAAGLRDGMNKVLAEKKVPWAVYGTFSGFHVFTNPQGLDIAPETFDPLDLHWEQLTAKAGRVTGRLRLAFALGGVDTNNKGGGITSAAHGPAEVEQTVAAFADAIDRLRHDGEI